MIYKARQKKSRKQDKQIQSLSQTIDKFASRPFGLQRKLQSLQYSQKSPSKQLQSNSQGRFVLQRQTSRSLESNKDQQQENKTGLPEYLRKGIENLSGLSMDDVKVHYNSPKPSHINALAYTQGNEIHLSPGQEKYLPHESWHVVQQKQQRVSGNMQITGLSVNNDPHLEQEADMMGKKAAMSQPVNSPSILNRGTQPNPVQSSDVIQCVGAVKLGFQSTQGVDKDSEDFKKLSDIVQQYKKEKKEEKKRAEKWFETQNKADPNAQNQYTEKLYHADMDKDEIKRRIRQAGLQIQNDNHHIMSSDGTEHLATLQEGNEAYTLKHKAEEKGLKQDIYTKNTLEGPSSTEYIKSNDRMVRRYATRGITPPEEEMIKKGGDVTPVFYRSEDRTQNQSGMHYSPDGTGKARDKFKKNRPTGDLDFLHNQAGVSRNFKKISQNNLPFLQERKGVNKLFSATSASRPIASNHGKGFGQFGEVTIDLAQVESEDILDHYSNRGEIPLHSHIPSEFVENPEKLKKQELRAGLTLIRNREIHLNKYPASAIVEGIKKAPPDQQGGAVTPPTLSPASLIHPTSPLSLLHIQNLGRTSTIYHKLHSLLSQWKYPMLSMGYNWSNLRGTSMMYRSSHNLRSPLEYPKPPMFESLRSPLEYPKPPMFESLRPQLKYPKPPIPHNNWSNLIRYLRWFK